MNWANGLEMMLDNWAMDSSHVSMTNFRVDDVSLEEIDSYVYFDRQMNTCHSLQPKIAHQGCQKTRIL